MTRTQSCLKLFWKIKEANPFPTICQMVAHLSTVIVIAKRKQNDSFFGFGGKQTGKFLSIFLPQWWAGFLSLSHIGLYVLPISTFWFGGFQFIGKIGISKCLPFKLEPDFSPMIHIKKCFFPKRIPSIMSSSGIKCTLKKRAGQIFQRWRSPRAWPRGLPHSLWNWQDYCFVFYPVLPHGAKVAFQVTAGMESGGHKEVQIKKYNLVSR